jgi:hypothetical protein
VADEVPDYHVIGDQIREEPQLLPGNGGIQQVYVVPYRIDSGPSRGHFGEVRVTEEDYTPDTVRQVIEDKVTTTHMIGDLGRSSA